MENIEPGAMPWLNRYVGNPVLTRLPQPALPDRRPRRALRHARRAPRRAAAARPAHDRDGVRVRDGDPRGASRASTIREFPIEYHPRGGESKLSPLRDGWRHLRLHARLQPDRALHRARACVTGRAGLAARCVDGARQTSALRAASGTIHTLIGGSLLIVVGPPGGRRSGSARGLRRLLHARERDALFEKWRRPDSPRARAAARCGL